MNIFEYIAVLTSIIIGLSITQLLYGVARIVQNPSRETVYWVHLVWAAYMFFTIVWWWWWQVALSSVSEWSLGLYLYVISFAVILYLICAILFPSDMEDYDGYRDYFFSRRRWFFGLLALAYLIDVGDTLLKGLDYFQSLGASYPVTMSLMLVLCAVAAMSSNSRFHAFFAVAALLSQAVMAITYTGSIGG